MQNKVFKISNCLFDLKALTKIIALDIKLSYF